MSPRPSAAPLVLRATGTRGIAREVVRLGRRHGCDGVVLCLEPGWPLRRRSGSGARSLAAALSSFGHVEVVVTGRNPDGSTGGSWPPYGVRLSRSRPARRRWRPSCGPPVPRRSRSATPSRERGAHGRLFRRGPCTLSSTVSCCSGCGRAGCWARWPANCWGAGRRPCGPTSGVSPLSAGGRRRRPAAGRRKAERQRRRFAWMGISYSSVVEAPLAEVFAWHARPGALARLSPPWLPGRWSARRARSGTGRRYCASRAACAGWPSTAPMVTTRPMPLWTR